MKKLISIISIVLVLSSIITSFCFAEQSDSEKIESICKKYNIVDMKSIPKNINPLEIKSASELQKFIDAASSELINKKDLDNTITLLADGRQTHSYFLASPVAFIVSAVNYRYEYDINRKRNYYAEIYSCTSYLDGVSFVCSYIPDNDATYANIVDNGLGIQMHTEGDIEYYLLIKGTFKLLTLRYINDHKFANP